MINGIINVYKEKGFTSHDVVAKLRGITRQKKIGHSGTLDPDAEGVLPVCFGNATRLCDRIGEEGKTYETILKLGVVTDTQDITGSVLSRSEVTVTEEEIRETALSFLGTSMQIPPMYSARKINGKKLYELAREGIVVERKATPITVSHLTVDKIDQDEVAMTISCSKGTYIRTICHDIGEKLGCGGCMKKLTRSRVGMFRLEHAVTLSTIEMLRDEGRLEEIILPTEEFFKDLPVVHAVGADGEKMLRNGNPLPLSLTDADPSALEVRMHTAEEVFIGIYQLDPMKKRLKPVRMFPVL